MNNMNQNNNMNVMNANGGAGFAERLKTDYNFAGRLVGLVAAVLTLISLFLPFIKASAYEYSSKSNLISQKGGAVFLVMVAIAAAAVIIGKWGGLIFGGAFNLIVMLISISSAKSQSKGVKVTMMVGYKMYIFACILLIAAGMLVVVRKYMQKKSM